MNRLSIRSRVARAALLGVMVWAATGSSGCGSPQVSAPSSVVRVHGTADSAFSAIRGAVEFATADTTGLECREVRITREPLVFAKSDAVEARAEVEAGRFALALPLRPDSSDGCDWRPTRLSLSFERPGEKGALRTRRGPDVTLVSAGERPPADTEPLPDTVRVVCLLSASVRPVFPPPVLCDYRRAPGGGYESLPWFWARADGGRLDVAVDVRLVPVFPADTHASRDTVALKRAYGVAP